MWNFAYPDNYRDFEELCVTKNSVSNLRILGTIGTGQREIKTEHKRALEEAHRVPQKTNKKSIKSFEKMLNLPKSHWNNCLTNQKVYHV